MSQCPLSSAGKSSVVSLLSLANLAVGLALPCLNHLKSL
jgi:hypothetical protein